MSDRGAKHPKELLLLRDDIQGNADATIEFLEGLDIDEELAAITIGVVLYSLCDTADVARDLLNHVIDTFVFDQGDDVAGGETVH